MGKIFPKLKPPIDPPDSVAPVQSLQRSLVYCLEMVAQMR